MDSTDYTDDNNEFLIGFEDIQRKKWVKMENKFYL